MNYERVIGVRASVLLGDKYRLNLSWDKALYEQSSICKFIGAKFSGPALKEAEKINDGDHISLDFYRQYYIKVKNVYIATLKWGKVTYNNDGTVSLADCMLTHESEVNNDAPNIGDDDIIIIDTYGHEREQHALNFTYNAYVANTDKQLYNFIEG